MTYSHLFLLALGVDVALAEVIRGHGTIYDAEVCDAAVRLINEKGYELPR
ncbi:hypothetical protein [Acinetobacter towneri]|nr:hypothetical protein [Acinetobacter towneri]MDV2485316.1 hypothetical protein [Acinetobacter towneri]